MKRILLGLAAALVALPALVTTAAAEDALSARDVERFIAALPALQAFGDRLEAEGKDEALVASASDLTEIMSPTFKPCSSGFSALESIGETGALSSLVRNAGFASLDTFSTVCDRTMKAYLSIKMQEAMADMPQLSEQMLGEANNLQPELMQSMQAMLGFATAAPSADVEVVRPFVPQIETWSDAP